MALKRRIQKRVCTAYGANETLIRWHSDSPMTFAGSLNEDSLFLALAAPAVEDRVVHSRMLIRELWAHSPQLGPYPFIESLSEMEHDRVFYPKYRDHVCHQFKVFLLGLYLYETLPLIHDAVLADDTGGRKIGGDADFLIAWTGASLFHDLGYLLENEQAKIGGNAWEWIRTEVNRILSAPVALSGAIVGFHQGLEVTIANRDGIPSPIVNAHESFESNGADSFWPSLALVGHRSCLSLPSNNNPLGTYYLYALRHSNADKRPQFRDHGISSALMLLKIWHCFRDRLQNLLTNSSRDLAEFQPQFKSLFSKVTMTQPLLIAAAQAIALHNINRDIWDNHHALENGLDFERYSIRLASDPAKSCPLAFLLGFADSLQEWDRQRFSSPQLDDSPRFIDQDIYLQTKDGKVQLAITSDAALRNPHDLSSSYSKCVRAMKRYLDPEYIDLLMTPDLTTLTSLVDDELAQTTTLNGLELYLSSFITEYKTSPDVRKDPLLRIYIPVRFEMREGFSNLPDSYRNEDLTSLVHYWISQDGCLMILLGDYGSGKTSFLRHLMYEQAIAFHDAQQSRIPILVRLRDHTDSFKYPHFLSQHLQTQCGFEVPFRVIEQLMEEGRLLILLDGFDELSTKATVETRQTHFQEIGKLFRKRNKIIVSSRPTYFLTDDEIRDIFKPLKSVFEQFDVPSSSEDRKRSLAKRRNRVNPLLKLLRGIEPDTHTLSNFGQPLSVTIAPFSKGEIISYLKAAAEQSKDWTWQELLTRIEDTFDLQDLAKRPILLKMIVATLPTLPRDKPISASELYEAYTIQWLERNYSTERPRHLVDKEASYKFMISLSRQMFEENVERVSYKKLATSITQEFKIVDDSQAEALATDIRTCSFLLRDKAGFLEFAHKSFREYFYSLFLLPRVMANEWAALKEPLPWEVLLFLGHHLQFEKEASFLRRQFNIVSQQHLNKVDSVFIQNCLTLYSSMMLPINGRTFVSLNATAFRLWRTESVDMRFDNGRLIQCRFEKNKGAGLVFQSSQLDGCAIIQSEFSAVRFDDVVFKNCEISDSIVIGGYVSIVRLVRSSLSRSSFHDVLFDRVRFFGVDFSDAEFKNCMLFGCEFVNCTGTPRVSDCRFQLCRNEESPKQLIGEKFETTTSFSDNLESTFDNWLLTFKKVDEGIQIWQTEVSSRLVRAQFNANEVKRDYDDKLRQMAQIEHEIRNIHTRDNEMQVEKEKLESKISPSVLRRRELKEKLEEVTDLLAGNRIKKRDLEEKLKQLNRKVEQDLERLRSTEAAKQNSGDEIERLMAEMQAIKFQLEGIVERSEATQDKSQGHDANVSMQSGRTDLRENVRKDKEQDKSAPMAYEVEPKKQELKRRLDEIVITIEKRTQDVLRHSEDIKEIGGALESTRKSLRDFTATKRKLERSVPNEERWELTKEVESIEREMRQIAARISDDESRIEIITTSLRNSEHDEKSLKGRIPAITETIGRLSNNLDILNAMVEGLKAKSEIAKDYLRIHHLDRDDVLEVNAFDGLSQQVLSVSSVPLLLALLGPRKVHESILKHDDVASLAHENWDAIQREVNSVQFVRTLKDELIN